MKKIILVNGVPASGKSTIAHSISESFNAQYLSVDDVKTPFLSRLEHVDRAFNRVLGASSYEAIWGVIRKGPSNGTYVIDAWFGFQPKELLQDYIKSLGDVKVLEVWNHIEPDVVAARYKARIGARSSFHPGEEYLPELIKLAHSARPMSISDVYTVDQGGAIDIELLKSWISARIEAE